MTAKLLLKITMLSVAILLLSTRQVLADNKIFTESGQIVDGDIWVMVDIYNDDTVVDMTGGMCDFVKTHDRGTFNMTGGNADGGAYDNSAMNLIGGTFNSFLADDYGTINLSGFAEGRSLYSRNHGTINITGGILEGVGAVDASTVNVYSGSNMGILAVTESAIAHLYGGLVSDYLGADDDSVIKVYGYNLHKISTGGTYGHGQVFGNWLDDTPFKIDIYDTETYSHIILVPEPSMMALFAIGSMLLKKSRRYYL